MTNSRVLVVLLAALVFLASGCWLDRALMLAPDGGSGASGAPDRVDAGLGGLAKVAALAGAGPLVGLIAVFRKLRNARKQQKRDAKHRDWQGDYMARAMSLAEVIAELAQEYIPADRKGDFLVKLKNQAIGHGVGHDLERQHAQRKSAGLEPGFAGEAAVE